MLDKIKSALLYGKDFCEDTAENIRETVVTAVDSAKLHYRIVSNRNELNNLYAILGRSLLAGAGTDDGKSSEEEINKLCERISKKEELLDGLLKQYRVVCGKVICPECGRFMSEKYAFCPHCGNHVNDVEDDEEADITGEDLSDVREIDGI